MSTRACAPLREWSHLLDGLPQQCLLDSLELHDERLAYIILQNVSRLLSPPTTAKRNVPST
jgi:hypothetical protein